MTFGGSFLSYFFSLLTILLLSTLERFFSLILSQQDHAYKIHKAKSSVVWSIADACPRPVACTFQKYSRYYTYSHNLARIPYNGPHISISFSKEGGDSSGARADVL